MPLGEIETHPYLNYWRNKLNIELCENLLNGSFPIYCISNSIPIEPLGHHKRQNWHLEAFRQGLYGSKVNKTESFVRSIFPEHLGNLEEILYQNKFIVSDVIKSCQRNQYSANDNDLDVLEFNLEILYFLQLKKLKYIYFTALKDGLPFKLFKKIIRRRYPLRRITYEPIGNSGNQALKIDNRKFYLGFLESPSPNAERFKNSNGWKRHVREFPDSTFADYQFEQWNQLIRKKNFNYDGTNAI